ncbi:MAG: acyl-CoA thioesterase [Desulfobacteraceae bacterium]|nr:acyl-CoA thioesterase [Desulfobacteraceae bacterium]
MKKPYFKHIKDGPEPLRAIVNTTTRFEEIDSMGIAWHGRFASYFEDARVALGEKYKISYFDLFRNGILAPLKKIHIDFKTPVFFREKISIECILHYTRASKISTEYIIKKQDNSIAATGYVIQMLLNPEYELFLTQPEYYKNFCEMWEKGEIR